MLGEDNVKCEGYTIMRKVGLRDVVGSSKPIPYQPKPEHFKAILHGEKPHYKVLVSWPAMECTDLSDGETMKPFIPYESTQEALDAARNDFIDEEDDEQRASNVVYYLLVFRERLSVELLNKKAKTELALELVPDHAYHDAVNPPPLPTKDIQKKDASGQPVFDSSGNPVLEKICIVKMESIGRVYWRVAIDKRGDKAGPAQLNTTAKTPQQLALERAQQAAVNAATDGMNDIDIG